MAQGANVVKADDLLWLSQLILCHRAQPLHQVHRLLHPHHLGHCPPPLNHPRLPHHLRHPQEFQHFIADPLLQL